MASRKSITESQKKAAEEEIKARQREVKYDLRDFTVDYLVQEFRKDRFYIPDYQRKFIWRPGNQCRFIESVLLGMPIPMMFVAEMDDDGRLEIVDGAQRIQTLEAFLDNTLILSGLQRLPALNDFRYSDLPPSRQRKLEGKALRLVVLEDETSAETRQEIFDRVNTSGEPAKPSEIRRGAHAGEFMKFVAKCAKTPLFTELCPMSQRLIDRYEGEELVIRFFAYSEDYLSFKHDVNAFLEEFVKRQKKSFDRERLKQEFESMLRFVKQNFPNGFAKSSKATMTPRVRFESIAVGVNLALRANPDLIPLRVEGWLDSDDFREHTTTHASNSLPRMKGRIEFVRDQLLIGLEH